MGKRLALLIVLILLLSGCGAIVSQNDALISDNNEGGGAACGTSASNVSNRVQGGDVAGGSTTTEQDKEHIWDGLLARGFTKEEAAGIFANMEHESHFNPFIAEQGRGHLWGHPGYSSYAQQGQARGSGYIGWGLVQWTYGRHDNVQAYVTSTLGEQYYVSQYSKDTSITSDRTARNKVIDAQLDYLVTELKGDYRRVLNAMLGQSAEKVSRVWTIDYEVPQNKHAQADLRAPKASAYLAKYSSRPATTNAAARTALMGNSVAPLLTVPGNSATLANSDPCAASLDASGAGHATAAVDAQLRNGGLYGKVCYNICVAINGKDITMPHNVDYTYWKTNEGFDPSVLEGATLSFPTEQRAFVAALAVARTNLMYSLGGGHQVQLNEKGLNGVAGGGNNGCGLPNTGYDCSGLAGSAWIEAGGMANPGYIPRARDLHTLPGAKPTATRTPGDILTSTPHAAIYLGEYAGKQWIFHARNCGIALSWTPIAWGGDGLNRSFGFDTNGGKVAAAGAQK